MKIKPLNDRVVVRPLAAETKTKAGIILPGAATEKSNRGVVVAVGTGVLTEEGVLKPLGIKPGDQVLYGKYAGSEIGKRNEELLIMRVGDILAIVDSDGEKECAA